LSSSIVKQPNARPPAFSQIPKNGSTIFSQQGWTVETALHRIAKRSIFRARDFSGQSRSRLRRACKKLPDGRITRSQIVRLGNAHARP
jgi:hypothetical protein